MARLPRIRRRSAPLGEPDYANPAVVDRLVREEGVDEETAERWFGEMLRFLDVCATSDAMLSPSETVDRAWHAFILNTRDYERYCRERFGRFLHHDPTGRPDPDAYARAYERIEGRHGQLDPTVWPVPLAAGAAAASGDDDEEHDGRARCSGGGCGGCGASGDGAHDTGGGGCTGGGASCGASCGGGGCGGGA